MKTFQTLQELHEEWSVNGACKMGVDFNSSCNTLQEVFEKCPLNLRLWRLRNGYIQFAEHCDWALLDGYSWAKLLVEQPQFAEFCNWSLLDNYDWIYLLIYQPKFAEYCNWSLLDGYSWDRLLIYQPQLAEYKK